MRIPHTLAGGLVWIAAAILFSQPATALSQEDPCHPNGAILRANAQKDGMRYVGWGVSERGNLVWMLVDPEDNQWTLIEAFDSERGPGCRVNGGDRWEWLSGEGGRLND